MQNIQAKGQAPNRQRVQVFIPVYNDVVFLPRALASVLNQQGVEVEVIVSDNASTDGTYEYVCEHAAHDPRITVHRNTSNLGHLRNLGRFAECVSADYYMLLCSDDMLGDATALARACTIMEQHPAAVSVYCDLLFVDGNDRKLAQLRLRQQGFFDHRAALRQSIVDGRDRFGIALLRRRAACAGLSYPDELPYLAETYFSARVGERGRMFHIAEPLIWNRYTGKNLTRSLMRNAAREHTKLGELFDIRLSSSERFTRMSMQYQVLASRWLFLHWARWRTLVGPGPATDRWPYRA
jgi:glycosyltransferase involved in cell wall biosynthesis